MPIPRSVRTACLSISLVCAIWTGAAAQPASAPEAAAAPRLTEAEALREVDRIAEAYAALGRFSGSVLVARGGRELFSRGYGAADRTTGDAATPDTRFDIGSLAKQFTAAAILRLESEGRLSVHDPVSRHLPEYPLPAGDRITLHHLLTHTAGLPSLGRRGPLETVREDCTAKTLDELMAYSRDLPLDFEPGAEFRYSNSGYMLLAAVVERVAGMPFDAYLRATFFGPAGMDDTGRLAPDARAPEIATGYTGYEPEVRAKACAHATWHTGEGGLHSTARDLLRWDAALAAGRILPPEQLGSFYHPHVQTGRAGRAYAYGWNRHQVHGRPVIHHNGGTEGFIAEFMRFPDDGDLLVIVLSNYLPDLSVNVPIRIVRAGSAAVLGQPYEVPPLPAAVPAAQLARFAGSYEVAPGYVVRVDTAGGRLMAETRGEHSWSLASVAAQRALSPSDTLAQGMRMIRAFVEGDVATLRRALAPARQGEVADSMFLFLRQLIETDPRFGPVRVVSPLRVMPDPTGSFVDARITFERGEWFLRAELDAENRLLGWYYGSTLPSRVELVPLGGAEFIADGFRWDEPDLRIRFVLRDGRVAEMVVDDPAGPVVAPRTP